MELIQIIYSILIYGGALLFLVIVFSFMISKARGINSSHNNLPNAEVAPIYLQNANYNYYKNLKTGPSASKYDQSEQTSLRKISSQTQPQIFHIDRINQREVKIIRKPTFHTNLEVAKDLQDRIQKNNSRYTIVNEQMNNSKSRVMNFYL